MNKYHFDICTPFQRLTAGDPNGEKIEIFAGDDGRSLKQFLDDCQMIQHRADELQTALQLAKDMIIANGLDIPKTMTTIHEALNPQMNSDDRLEPYDTIAEQQAWDSLNFESSKFSPGGVNPPADYGDNWTAGIDRDYTNSGIDRRHYNCIEVHADNRHAATRLRDWLFGAMIQRQSINPVSDSFLLHVLEEISHDDSLEDNEYEIHCEDEFGREGSTYISIPKYCQKALAEIERLSGVGAVNAQELLDRNVRLEVLLSETIRQQHAERAYYKDRIGELHDTAVHYWQNNGEDHLESLCTGVPVVIEAQTLRQLLKTQYSENDSTEIWLGSGDKMISDIHGDDWHGIGIFDAGEYTGPVGNPIEKLKGVSISELSPISLIKTTNPKSLEVLTGKCARAFKAMTGRSYSNIDEISEKPVICFDEAPADVRGEVLRFAESDEWCSFSWDDEDNEAMPATAEWLERYNVYAAVFQIPRTLRKSQNKLSEDDELRNQFVDGVRRIVHHSQHPTLDHNVKDMVSELWQSVGSKLTPQVPEGLKKQFTDEVMRIAYHNQKMAPSHRIRGLASTLWRFIEPHLVAASPIVEERVRNNTRPIYTCKGKGGRYEYLGTTTGAGTMRGTYGEVYRDVDTDRLFHRERNDFQERMELVKPESPRFGNKPPQVMGRVIHGDPGTFDHDGVFACLNSVGNQLPDHTPLYAGIAPPIHIVEEWKLWIDEYGHIRIDDLKNDRHALIERDRRHLPLFEQVVGDFLKALLNGGGDE